MRRTLLATALALLAALPVHAQQATRIDDAAMARAATLRPDPGGPVNSQAWVIASGCEALCRTCSTNRSCPTSWMPWGS